MAAGDALGSQFSRQLRFHLSDTQGSLLAEHPEHGTVGELYWHPTTGEVAHIETHHPHQRKGVATAMWRHAQANVDASKQAPPEHSSSRSMQGQAWALSMKKRYGDYVPPWDPVT